MIMPALTHGVDRNLRRQCEVAFQWLKTDVSTNENRRPFAAAGHDGDAVEASPSWFQGVGVRSLTGFRFLFRLRRASRFRASTSTENAMAA